MPRPGDPPATHFGFRDVPLGDKQALVDEVFHKVARRYDLMNDLMSAGVHRLWKGAMIDWLNPRAGQSILDVGGGTGDIAFRILERRPDARVTVCDLTPAMLDQGRDRAVDRGILSGIEWVAGNAEHLPFDDMQFDAFTIGFCLRNVADWDAALREATEVLDLHEALKLLAQVNSRQCRVVELRYFGGLSIEDVAEVLSVSTVTVTRDWHMARAWLARELGARSAGPA